MASERIKNSQIKQKRSRIADSSKTGPGRATQIKSGENRTGQSKAGQGKTGQSNFGQSKVGQSKPGKSKPGKSKAGQVKTPQAKKQTKRPTLIRSNSKATNNFKNIDGIQLSSGAGSEYPQHGAKLTTLDSEALQSFNSRDKSGQIRNSERNQTDAIGSENSRANEVQNDFDGLRVGSKAGIQGGSKTAKSSSSKAGMQGGSKTRLSGSKIRLSAIAVIVSSLVFAIGVQVGTRNSEALLDNAVETILKTGANELDRKVLERAAIEGMLKATGDEWANYFPKSALQVLQEQSSNMFTGIGVWLAKSRGGQVRISSIQEGSPASKSGLLVGDQILEVNGTDVRGASLTSVIGLIRGDIGKRLELLVMREDRKVLATLSARKVELKTVEARQVSEKIALMEISSFSLGTAQEVRDALSDLSYSSGVILDLRNNPGGLIDEAVKVAELFIGKGVVVSYQVNDAERLYKVANLKPINAPLIVMINRNTASSAEILAGAFQDRNRGVVIGERSYGKGSVQEFITLGDGSKIELTVALYRTPSGRVIDEVGIIPDLEVPNSEIGEKALQVLGGLSRLTSK